MGPLMYLGETEQTGFQFDPVLAAFAVGIVAMCTRWGQLGIYISPAGVTVRNFFRSHHLSWGEVEEFWLHDHGLSVRTKDDVIHPTCYFSRYPINPVVMDLQYRPLHRKLQAELRAAREAAQPGLRREPSSLPEN